MIPHDLQVPACLIHVLTSSRHRYLIESGMYRAAMAINLLPKTNCNYLDYKETAVRLQKEWNIQDPQKLPFAPHVTNHALVTVLNKGLVYNAVERGLSQVYRHHSQASHYLDLPARG